MTQLALESVAGVSQRLTCPSPPGQRAGRLGRTWTHPAVMGSQ